MLRVPVLLITALVLLPAAEKVDQLYARHCAACHGQDGSGGLGGSLVDGVWTHAVDGRTVEAVISDGLPQMGMQAFAGNLSDEQIRGLAVYIAELERRAQAAPRTPRADGAEISTQHQRFTIDVLVDQGLKTPWGLCHLSDGRMLVSERSGRLRIVGSDGRLSPEPVRDLPAIVEQGQGGLMEVVAHPDHAANGWIYLSFAEPAADGSKRALTVVQRGRLRDGAWVESEDILRFDQRFYGGAGVHFGCRIVLHDGYLFCTLGDRGDGRRAQDLGYPNGSVFRVHDDGRVPVDNPFANQDGAIAAIWSYGHRNPQGLAYDAGRGLLFSTEHGPRGGDELNLILKSHNYGWPEITYGINYNGTPITAETERPGMDRPLLHWTPSIATCGLHVCQGEPFAAWRGDLLVGSLKAQQLQRVRLDDDLAVVEKEVVLNGLGRIRTVNQGPDGLIYLVTNGPDRIIRLRPSP